jgi:hypothetical protein
LGARRHLADGDVVVRDDRVGDLIDEYRRAVLSEPM